MSDKKIIAVAGATGAQGGGLVRAILNDPNGGFAARAITRDVKSDKARALAQLGAEVVAADVDDEASLSKAFAGAYGAYCVTFFWAHFSPEKEIAEARNMAKAAKAAGVQHVIWSTLEDTRQWVPLSDDRMPTLMGKYKVPHFDGKGESNKVFTDLGVPPEVYRGFGFPGAEDLGNMFQFKRDFEQVFCGARKLETARSLNPSLQTFDQWLARNAKRIPLA